MIPFITSTAFRAIISPTRHPSTIPTAAAPIVPAHIGGNFLFSSRVLRAEADSVAAGKRLGPPAGPAAHEEHDHSSRLSPRRAVRVRPVRHSDSEPLSCVWSRVTERPWPNGPNPRVNWPSLLRLSSLRLEARRVLGHRPGPYGDRAATVGDGTVAAGGQCHWHLKSDRPGRAGARPWATRGRPAHSALQVTGRGTASWPGPAGPGTRNSESQAERSRSRLNRGVRVRPSVTVTVERHLESCMPGQDLAKWHVPVRTGALAYQYMMEHDITRIPHLYEPEGLGLLHPSLEPRLG